MRSHHAGYVQGISTPPIVFWLDIASCAIWEREGLPAYRKKSARCSWRAKVETARPTLLAWYESCGVPREETVVVPLSVACTPHDPELHMNVFMCNPHEHESCSPPIPSLAQYRRLQPSPSYHVQQPALSWTGDLDPRRGKSGTSSAWL